MLKKVSFKFKGKRTSINAKKCTGLRRFLGLMFKKREEADVLLFEFEKPVNLGIHSIFVFFPFIAVWLDEKNTVIETKIVKPFTIPVKNKGKYKRLLEIPLNSRYGKNASLLSS